MSYQIKNNKIIFKDIKKIGFEELNDISDNISEVVLPDGLEVILEDAFFDKTNLKKINIPNTVREIQSQSFWGLDNLKEIVLFPTIEKIDKNAFCNCVNLTIKVMCNKNNLPKSWNNECFSNIKELKFMK